MIRGMMFSGLKADTTPVDDIFSILNAEEAKASNAYRPSVALKYGTSTPAVHNDSIGTFVDLKGVAGANLIYQGPAAPSVIGVTSAGTEPYTGRPPILYKTGSPIPCVEFVNIAELNYDSSEFMSETFPTAVTLGFLSKPGQEYEAWMNQGGSLNYLGDLGGKLRVGGNDIAFNDVDSPTYFMNSYIHMEIDSTNCKVWINGTAMGSIPTSDWVADGLTTKVYNNLATDTNSAPFDFYFLNIFRNAEMPWLVANRATYLASIGDKWNIGTMQALPYLDEFEIELSGSNYQPIASELVYHNASSTQISNTKWLWFLRILIPDDGGGRFSEQIPVYEGKVMPASVISSYANKGALALYAGPDGCQRLTKSWDYEF